MDYNVHNFDLSDEERHAFRHKVFSDLTMADMAPERVAVFLLGDFNLYKQATMYPRAPEADKRRSQGD
eukprot:5014541-Pyramimonas_sp.AAC.1